MAVWSNAESLPPNIFIVKNRAPLLANAFYPLPLGSILPLVGFDDSLKFKQQASEDI
jgi:hypothetical protein